MKPPAPGVPRSASDITGIYRSIGAGVLQLRANGNLNLTVPGSGASSGTYTLADGRMDLVTEGCGDELGRYEVTVAGEQEPGKANLIFRPVRDECAPRRQALTRDPWVYADS